MVEINNILDFLEIIANKTSNCSKTKVGACLMLRDEMSFIGVSGSPICQIKPCLRTDSESGKNLEKCRGGARGGKNYTPSRLE